jgi:DNA repair exonuclease SbcCD ATPase subunit
MKELSAEQVTEVENLVISLDQAKDAVNDKASELNKHVDELNDKIQSYNNALKNARDFCDTILEGMKNYFSEQSDDWREGDEGGKYTGWIDEWDEPNLEDVNLINEIEIDGLTHAEALQDLSTSLE